MLDWAKLLLGLVGLVSSLVSWARERQLISAAQGAAIAEALRVQAKEVDAANAARAAVQSAARNGRLPDNDGFRRD